MNICEEMWTIRDLSIPIEDTIESNISLSEWARLNLRKPQSSLCQKINEYLMNGVEGDRQIWHQHNGGNRPVLMRGRGRTRNDTNPSRSARHLNALMIRQKERCQIKGESGHGWSGGCGRNRFGGDNGDELCDAGWMTAARRHSDMEFGEVR